MDESASAVASPEQERSVLKKRREWIRCGVACAVCGKDQWWIYQGSNRCDCGQVLWVERVRSETGATRFPYRQGPELPAAYPGQMRTTE